MTLRQIGKLQTPVAFTPLAALKEAAHDHNMIHIGHLIAVLDQLANAPDVLTPNANERNKKRWQPT